MPVTGYVKKTVVSTWNHRGILSRKSSKVFKLLALLWRQEAMTIVLRRGPIIEVKGEWCSERQLGQH